MLRQDVRLKNHASLSVLLERLSDGQLIDLIDKSTPFHSGTGGKSAVGKLQGKPIFIKKIPLTMLENQPENYLSTHNVFNLPMFFQYGVGSPGFGVWRELVSHQFANKWVLTKKCSNFPLMYHWRVLPRANSGGGSSEEKQKLERQVDYWEGSESVRKRYEELHAAPNWVVVFLEYFPNTLSTWLDDELGKDEESRARALLFVEQELRSTNDFLAANQFLHFDAHFKNILTDSEGIYFADFGLAISSQFKLSEEEHKFFQRHHLYDIGMSSIGLVYSIFTHFRGMDSWGQDMEQRIEALQKELPSELARILINHTSAALVMADLFEKLRNESKQFEFPSERLETAIEKK